MTCFTLYYVYTMNKEKETEQAIGLDMTYEEITVALKKRERKVKARRERKRRKQAVYSSKKFYRVRIQLDGVTKIFWAKTKIVKKNSPELNEEKERIYKFLEKTNDSFFITGKAGTGKSTLLNHFKNNTEKKVVILAPTGVAALNVNGSTIHSFFKFPLLIKSK